MKKILLSILGLGMIATAPVAQAARIDLGDIEIRDGRRIVVDHDRDYDRHRHSRLVSESRRRIVEPDGDRVIITRRVFQEPDGDRFVRETRRVVDRW